MISGYNHFPTLLTSTNIIPPEDDPAEPKPALTPWSRVLLEKLTGFAANQELPTSYGT